MMVRKYARPTQWTKWQVVCRFTKYKRNKLSFYETTCSRTVAAERGDSPGYSPVRGPGTVPGRGASGSAVNSGDGSRLRGLL